MHRFYALLPLCLLAAAYIPAAQADGYSKGYSQETLDEATARRALAEIPGFKMGDVWFATGNENYYKSPACVTERGIWVFTKPVATSPGLYRGRVSYVEESPENRDKPTCNQMKKGVALSVPTASFVDPDTMHPEEAFDGQVPGVFHVDGKISDSELLKVAAAIPKIRSCFKSDSSCPYKIDKSALMNKAYAITPALKVENLLQLNFVSDPNASIRHYEMIFANDSPYGGAQALDIYCKDGEITKIRQDIEVVE